VRVPLTITTLSADISKPRSVCINLKKAFYLFLAEAET